MKTKLNYTLLLAFFALLTFSSCQDEVIEITDPNSEETFQADSNLAALISDASINDGSSDNIIDGANELSVNLPITVTANGIQIIVNSEEDFDLIEEVFDEFEEDSDELEIQFPITVTLRDHTEVVVNNHTELNNLRDDNPNEDDDDIECIDFQYPITFSTYSTNFQIIDVITINSDRELYRFMHSLEAGVLVSLNFPVTMIYKDGTTIEVNSNLELARVISEARDACDEDDDNDWNDDDFTKERLDELLVTCPWIVHDVRRNSNNLTDDYREYLMIFNEDGVVKVRARNGDMLTGTWSTRVTDRGAKITLDFDSLVDFTLEWFVYEIRSGKIKLFTEGDNRIILEKTCDTVVDHTIDRIENILKECLWRVARLEVDGTDNNEDDYIGTPLKFFDNGVVEIRVNGELVSGTWDVLEYNNAFVLQINLDGRPELQLEWIITFLEPYVIKLESQENEMIIKRHCPDGDDDVNYINNVLNEGEWEVALYMDENVDETDDFYLYVVDFIESGRAKVTDPNNGITSGSWLAYRNDEGMLKLGLRFTEEPFNELSYRWKIAEISENRIELIDYSSTGSVESRLVFERL